jgi:hypothetical protein
MVKKFKNDIMEGEKIVKIFEIDKDLLNFESNNLKEKLKTKNIRDKFNVLINNNDYLIKNHNNIPRDSS